MKVKARQGKARQGNWVRKDGISALKEIQVGRPAGSGSPSPKVAQMRQDGV